MSLEKYLTIRQKLQSKVAVVSAVAFLQLHIQNDCPIIHVLAIGVDLIMQMWFYTGSGPLTTENKIIAALKVTELSLCSSG